jgi:spoIIIJ-associated protein
MDIIIRENLEEILQKLSTPFRKIRIEKIDNNTWRANIESEEPSLLIGHHGENIFALQNILRTIIFRKQTEDFNVVVDIDDYRKRQEENVIKLAERKVETVRQTGKKQSLPPMSPYFRRLIHVHLAQNDFSDIETQSQGEGDYRYLTIKPKGGNDAMDATEDNMDSQDYIV